MAPPNAQPENAPTSAPPSLTVAGGIARLALNRPAHRNRLESGDLAWLRATLPALAADRAALVVIIESRGKAFSAGFNLEELAAGELGDAESGPGGFGAMVDLVERLPQPTIARLHGGVYGGATDLALACDFRIGVAGMEAMMPAAKLGLPYYRSGLERYASRLGVDNAKRMFLTAARIPAAELLRIGFLTDLVAPEALDATVDTLAATIAGLAPLAVQGAKLALNDIAAGRLDEEAFVTRTAAALASNDFRAGRAAIGEKRLVKFTGT